MLVTVRYRIAGEDPDPFLDAIEDIGRQRRSDGAYAWGIFADVAEKGVYLETFLIGSWLEARYLRERVTEADRAHENLVKSLLAEPPNVTLDARRGFAEERRRALPGVGLLSHHVRNDRLTFRMNRARCSASARSMP